MAISGGIKFFYQNFGDIDDDNASASVSSGSSSRNNARSRKNYLFWISEGSNDSTAEFYELRFGYSRTMNRIILKEHNFKAFNVQYWNGSAWTHFSNVVTKEGTQTNITETANTKTTSYYEFDEVSTEKIRINIDTTQTVDDEKQLFEAIGTYEIGTFQGYPIYSATNGRKTSEKEAISGRKSSTIFGEYYSCILSFARYPVAADHTIMQTLWDLRLPFLIYPCGGNSDQFRYSGKIGNRLKDIYLVDFQNDFSPNYDLNVYQNSLNYDVSLIETI